MIVQKDSFFAQKDIAFARNFCIIGQLCIIGVYGQVKNFTVKTQKRYWSFVIPNSRGGFMNVHRSKMLNWGGGAK